MNPLTAIALIGGMIAGAMVLLYEILRELQKFRKDYRIANKLEYPRLPD